MSLELLKVCTSCTGMHNIHKEKVALSFPSTLIPQAAAQLRFGHQPSYPNLYPSWASLGGFFTPMNANKPFCFLHCIQLKPTLVSIANT